MKSIFTIAIFTLLVSHSFASVAADFLGDPPSTHGMLLFGQKEIYLSHLPMFHKPHDYQVILNIQLDGQAQTIYLNDQSQPANKDLFYTFVPERFVLPEVVSEKRCFKGSIYRGHFERGGQVIVPEARACIVNVLDFEKLNAKVLRPSQWTGFIFGQGQDAWLVHKITSRPDFDQIVHIERARGVTGFLPFTLNLDNGQAITNAQTITVDTAQTHEVVTSVQSLYLETGDLE